jgi:hypothetical protein
LGDKSKHQAKVTLQNFREATALLNVLMLNSETKQWSRDLQTQYWLSTCCLLGRWSNTGTLEAA